jgi:hypothetical protein
MSFRDRSLKIAENPLCVVSLDPEAKVIEPQMLPRLIGRVKTKKPVLELQFTEVFPLIVNRESREPLARRPTMCFRRLRARCSKIRRTLDATLLQACLLDQDLQCRVANFCGSCSARILRVSVTKKADLVGAFW